MDIVVSLTAACGCDAFQPTFGLLTLRVRWFMFRARCCHPVRVQTERFGNQLLASGTISSAGADIVRFFEESTFVDGPDCISTAQLEPTEGEAVSE